MQVSKHKKVLIAFFDVYDSREEMSTELIESAYKMGGLCFQKDITIMKKICSLVILSMRESVPNCTQKVMKLFLSPAT